MGIDAQVNHHVVAMGKVAEQHVLVKCSKCNIFQVIRDLMQDFMNFNAGNIILRIHKKIINKDPSLVLTKGNLPVD